jgi:hypothetical protein
MKLIMFDHSEFGHGSETQLSIAVAHMKEFESIQDFYSKTCTYEIFEDYWNTNKSLDKKYLSKVLYSGFLVNTLIENCDVKLPSDSEVFVAEEDWNIHDYILQNKHSFYRCSWVTFS